MVVRGRVKEREVLGNLIPQPRFYDRMQHLIVCQWVSKLCFCMHLPVLLDLLCFKMDSRRCKKELQRLCVDTSATAKFVALSITCQNKQFALLTFLHFLTLSGFMQQYCTNKKLLLPPISSSWCRCFLMTFTWSMQ